MNGLEHIAEAFAGHRTQGRAALMPYFTLGYPTVAGSLDIIAALAGAGADFIVLGDDDTVLFANDGFYKKFQFERDEIYNKRIEDIFYFVNARLKGGIAEVRKIGRTHLQDAVPMTLGQEFSGYARQVELGIERLAAVEPRLAELALGGTAVGTGVNAHPDFAAATIAWIAQETGIDFREARNHFEAQAARDAAVEASGALKTVAVSLSKIANDVRWLGSGPRCGIGEINLPSLQPGSSIMPGKVNPVIPEAVCMVAAQVIGNDAAITLAGQSGSFQLNVMLPLVALNLLQSLEILSSASNALADKAIAHFTVREDNIRLALERNPILVTALNPVIGYERGAAIAKKAYSKGKPIRDVAAQMTDLSKEDLARLLDPLELTKGGIKS